MRGRGNACRALACGWSPLRGRTPRSAARSRGPCCGPASRRFRAAAVIDAFLREQQPDVVLFTPLIGVVASPQLDCLQSARALGYPTALCVWSWDHLSSKAILRTVPDRVFVWNDTQRHEAVTLHGVPPDRVVVTGAQCFDQWFDRRPSMDRDDFCRKVGLPADRPFLLYVCSALFQGSASEARFVQRWVRALRASGLAPLASTPILVRPHPSRMKEWADVDLSSEGDVVLWGRNPVDADARRDYFDSLFHSAAVVGLNTSAFLEGAIAGRPVYATLLPEHHENQEGTIHFHYLLSVKGGLLHTARTLGDHVEQLNAALKDAGSESERSRRFVEAFIRPRGVDVAATPVFADEVEQLAAIDARPRGADRAGPGCCALRCAPVAALAALDAAAPLMLSAHEREITARHRAHREQVTEAWRVKDEHNVEEQQRKQDARRASASATRPSGPPSGAARRTMNKLKQRLKKRIGMASCPMKILFLARHFSYLRLFESAIAELAERGHALHLSADREESLGGAGMVERLAARYPDVTVGWTPGRAIGRVGRAGAEAAPRHRLPAVSRSALRRDAAAARRGRRSGRRQASCAGWRRCRCCAAPAGRRALAWVLRQFEQAVPRSRELEDFYREQTPDVVLITPLVDLGLAAARSLPERARARPPHGAVRRQLGPSVEQVAAARRPGSRHRLERHAEAGSDRAAPGAARSDRRHRRAVLRPVVRPPAVAHRARSSASRSGSTGRGRSSSMSARRCSRTRRTRRVSSNAGSSRCAAAPIRGCARPAFSSGRIRARLDEWQQVDLTEFKNVALFGEPPGRSGDEGRLLRFAVLRRGRRRPQHQRVSRSGRRRQARAVGAAAGDLEGQPGRDDSLPLPARASAAACWRWRAASRSTSRSLRRRWPIRARGRAGAPVHRGLHPAARARPSRRRHGSPRRSKPSAQRPAPRAAGAPPAALDRSRAPAAVAGLRAAPDRDAAVAQGDAVQVTGVSAATRRSRCS